MKKLIFFFLTFALLPALSGCGDIQTASKGAARKSSTVSQLIEETTKDSGTVKSAPEPIAEMEFIVQEPMQEYTASEGEIDVDLTRMSSTMIYAEVSNMMYCPDNYAGKIVRMQGQNINFYYDVTDQIYHSVVIDDATACCAQGLEYVLADDTEEYPDDDLEITVTGKFELYEEFGIIYCRLTNATIDT